MYNHSGTTDFLRLLVILGFVALSVWWLQGAIGTNYTVLVIFALVGVMFFAGGALFAHLNQKQTLDAITKFNASDAQIDRYRQQSFKALAGGEAALRKAQAQLTVIDAKRVDRLAQERARALTVDNGKAADNSFWTMDEDTADADSGFQEWR